MAPSWQEDPEGARQPEEWTPHPRRHGGGCADHTGPKSRPWPQGRKSQNWMHRPGRGDGRQVARTPGPNWCQRRPPRPELRALRPVKGDVLPTKPSPNFWPEGCDHAVRPIRSIRPVPRFGAATTQGLACWAQPSKCTAVAPASKLAVATLGCLTALSALLEPVVSSAWKGPPQQRSHPRVVEEPLQGASSNDFHR